MLRRGYSIYVGKFYNKEIDFVAERRGERIYVQVAANIDDLKTKERELSSLLEIKGGYPKILLARTRTRESSFEGIKIIDLVNWLANKSSVVLT